MLFLLIICSYSQADTWRQRISTEICQQWQDISAIKTECELSFVSVSNQFQLPFCESDWQFQLIRSIQAGRNGIEISCLQPNWKQNLSIQLHIYKEVAVLAKPLGIGQVVTAADITMQRQDIGTLSKDFFSAIDEVAGLESKRSFKVGTVLSSDMLNAPQLVERGAMVKVILERHGLHIEAKGFALENGRKGQTIRVKNSRTQRIVRGKVIADNTILIN